MHPLQSKVRSLARHARWLLVLHGLSWVVAVVLLTILAVGLSDWLFRFEDPGIRLMATGSVVVAGGWAIARYLWTALKQRYDDVAVALRIEKRFPELNDRLASTLQFLQQTDDDPTAGSADLRRAVIAETTAEVQRLDLSQVIDSQPTKRITLAAAGICLLAAAIALFAPRISSIALARLINPLGSDAWPQQHHLQMREPVTRVALGQPLRLEVVDAYGAKLPDDVRLRLRYTSVGDQKTEEVISMQFVKDAFVHTLDSVTRPFEYKAEGGDDTSMPWTQLEVVEPPALESLAVTLHPPAYTGWPSEQADKHFRALKGTRVELRGTTTKRLSAATLKLENGVEVPAEVTGEGYQFTVPSQEGPQFIVEQTGSYYFELKDLEGFVGGSHVRYEMRVTPDVPPSVAIEQPKGNVYVTPQATVPIALAVKDDLAIHDVSLVYLRSDASDQGETVVPLYEGPEQVDPAVAANRGEMGENRRVEHRWDLGPLDLKPGVQISFHGIAHDYLPQLGRSQPGRITIITPEELADRIAQRQSLILGELSRALKMQQDSRTQVSSLEIQLQDVGQLQRRDVDRLQSADLSQRQVKRTLADPSEGVPSQIQGLLDDLANNKLDSPDVERRMQQLLDEIQRIDREHLSPIEHKLQAAVKEAQAELDQGQAPDNKRSSELAETVTSAGQEQDRVIAALEQMLGDLSQWDNYRRFQRDIAQLRNEQEQLQRDTSELGRETLTKDADRLTPQQQADLKKLAQQQAELARRFDRALQQMAQMQDELEKNDPLAAGVIEDAVHQARQQGTGGQMREASQNISQNQVGQASQQQQQVAEKLQDLLDILANRSEHELSRLVKKLREAEQELAELRKEQQGLRKKLEEAAKNPDEQQRRRELERLTRQQRQLQEQAERMARKLQRLQAQQAGRSMAQAGRQMSKAGQQGEQGDAGGAQDAADAAQRDLDEAQQALAERRRQAEIDLAVEQLAKIEDGLKSLHAQQQEVIAETNRLEEIRKTEGKWTRGQLLSVRDLARQQNALREETDALSEKLSAAQVFSLALQGAGKEMARAVIRLEERDTGPTTLAVEENALRRLSQLLESLKPDKPKAGEKDEQQGEGQGQGGGQGNQPPGDGIPSLAQLKLLKLMQEEVHERTKALEEAARQGLSPEQLQEYVQLSEEQTQLADMVLNLSKPSDKPPEDDLDQLPGPRTQDDLERKLQLPLDDGLLPQLETKEE